MRMTILYENDDFFRKFIYEAMIKFSFNARVLEVSTVLVEFQGMLD
jgi:hypothetical protein